MYEKVFFSCNKVIFLIFLIRRFFENDIKKERKRVRLLLLVIIFLINDLFISL